MKVICIPVVNRPECAVALSTAFDIGQQLGATVMGYHLRKHGDSDVSLPDEVAAMISGEEDNDEASNPSQEDACSLFAQVAESKGYIFKKKAANSPVALWQAKAGSPDKLFSIVGPVTDLIVVSRPANKNSVVASKFMQSALLNSAKPVLILPQESQATVGKHISIAWNQSAEAARAVTAAIPLMRQAESVNIITNGVEDRVGPKSRHLQQYLTMHGIDANHIQCREKDDTEALLSSFQQTQSDLMVMGAYSRSRLRQLIFGGVTEHMLYQADIPVLMLHT